MATDRSLLGPPHYSLWWPPSLTDGPPSFSRWGGPINVHCGRAKLTYWRVLLTSVYKTSKYLIAALITRFPVQNFLHLFKECYWPLMQNITVDLQWWLAWSVSPCNHSNSILITLTLKEMMKFIDIHPSLLFHWVMLWKTENHTTESAAVLLRINNTSLIQCRIHLIVNSVKTMFWKVTFKLESFLFSS